MSIHIDYAVNEDCLNFYDSYGEICVHCNACGRFNKETMHEDYLKVLKEHVKENINLSEWMEGYEELQKSNIQENIKYLEDEIKRVEDLIKTKGSESSE